MCGMLHELCVTCTSFPRNHGYAVLHEFHKAFWQQEARANLGLVKQSVAVGSWVAARSRRKQVRACSAVSSTCWERAPLLQAPQVTVPLPLGPCARSTWLMYGLRHPLAAQQHSASIVKRTCSMWVSIELQGLPMITVLQHLCCPAVLRASPPRQCY